MGRRTVSTLAALVVLVALPASADAHKRHHHHARPAAVQLWTVPQILALALWDAEAYWQGAGSHAAPCGGDVRFVGAPLPAAGEIDGGHAGAGMWTGWDNYGTYVRNGVPMAGDWGNAEGPEVSASEFTNCTISYSEAWWDSAHRMTQRWPELAQNVAHELEHLENRWWVETTVDDGPLAISAVPLTAVNYPRWTCHNEPASAERYRPPNALTQRQAAELSSCVR